jgi:DUF2938 family protein
VPPDGKTWNIDMDYFVCILLTGIGATAITDLWPIARRRLLGMALPDYGLVGRWIAWMPRGRFFHDPISATARVRGERAIGWVVHYLIGMAFAGLLPALWGAGWIHQPTLLPALIVGIGTVAAPFLVMQPGMGAGVAASRTPRPATARLQSLVTHAIFGLGLYASGLLASLVIQRGN